MGNKERYTQVFCETFEIEEKDTVGLEYGGTPKWDSVGQIMLISALENEFGIEIDTDDMIDLKSFEKGLEMLGEKYHVGF